jgi:outer membrane receptor protein involved in Fe transport
MPKFPKAVPDKPFEPGDHRASKRVFPRPVNDGCGTSDAGCASPLPDAALYYKPETLTSYEIGIKTKAFSNKLRISADYFHYDYDNLS